MAKIAVVGSPGQGKTTAMIPYKNEKLGIDIKGVDPKTTVLIDVKNQGAFQGYDTSKSIKDGGNYLNTDDSKTIAAVIKFIADSRLDVKLVWLDDLGYTMSFEQFKNAMNKNYDVWKELAYNHMLIYDAIKYAEQKRKDLHFACMYHMEMGDDKLFKIKTSGKMLDNTVKLDGLFNIIIFTEVSKQPNGKVEYNFRVVGDGSSTCRSPLGMFDEAVIPNDFGLVLDAVNKYYNIK